ncbi:MAG TPA: RNA 2',3'-cyclic phosphodiesterase [Conexibacter sp.]|nr:RNA 2',3'-cyclic phosphodiesterase [Conexibacter sp.]
MAARLFVSLDLPDTVVEALVAWRAPLLRERKELRAVAPQALHVTLCFLGTRPEKAIAPLATLVEACAMGAGGVSGLAFGEQLWLPRRRPRVLAVALEDRHGQLGSLQEQLVERLAADGWHDPEARGGRDYLPHVTVARVRGRDAVPRAVVLPTTASGGGRPPAVVFEGAALTLYRSHLLPDGARYEPLSVSRLA